ncbi:flavohemoprotein [Catellatospora sp. TT07R-123]|uniref:globin domain-containing protein n=1 Tax=Catellatospora sp. TT07R-123 TaxID=2733863 RepID=UPI001B1C6B28|nr:globin domain-containing protein [Catellatospora sp. TT07R-123]GHJ46536.1 flavohemoprotein [Catellatospora sp. TT07R-123]
MSDLQRLLKESWTLVEEQQDKLAGYFYARIFLNHPSVREMFPVTMDVQRARLLGAIVSAVQTVDDPDRFDEYLRSLGRDHRKFQVQADQYEVVGAALLESLRTFARDEWTHEYEQAWRDAYDVIARKMLAGAAADSNPAWWHAEVVAHERRSRDIAVFTVRPLQQLEYRAGQYLSLECPRYHPRVWRTYSVANAPRSDGTMDFHVRALGAGWVSGALVRRTRVGDMLRLASPMGTMVLDRRSTRDIVFVAGGTGLSPIKALLEELTTFNRTRWVHVFFGARDRDDLYDLGSLQELAAAYPWLSIVPVCSDDPGWGGEEGTIPDALARFGPWLEHDFFVCGSPSMVRGTLRSLAQLQVPQTRIRYDAFSDV